MNSIKVPLDQTTFMKFLIIIFTFLTCSTSVFSQNPRVINAAFDNYTLKGYNALFDSQGNYVLSTQFQQNGGYSGRITILDYSYTALWTFEIDSLNSKDNGQLIELANGEYLATFPSGLESGGVIAKFDLNGMIWAKKMSYDDGVIVNTAQLNNDNIALIVELGPSWNSSTSVVILDSDGNEIWSGKNSSNIRSSCLSATSDGNFILSSVDPIHQFLTKIDPLGSVIWSKTYNIGTVDTGVDIIESSTGDIYTVGIKDSITLPSGGSADIVARKFDSNGDFLAGMLYKSDFYDGGNSIVELNNGDFVLMAETRPQLASTQPNVAFLKVDQNLQLISSKTYGDSTGAGHYFNQLRVKNNLLYTYGRGWYNSTFPGTWGLQSSLLKMSDDLELPCMSYPQSFTAEPLTIFTTDPSALSFIPLLVYFEDENYNTVNDMIIFDRCDEEFLNLENPETLEMSVSPNPASTAIRIALNAISMEIKEIQLIDLSGKKHLQISNVNSQEIDLDVSSLTNGIYFISIKTENALLTQKVIVSH
jgi:hypothetical protein